jgi:hypothetical protein
MGEKSRRMSRRKPIQGTDMRYLGITLMTAAVVYAAMHHAFDWFEDEFFGYDSYLWCAAAFVLGIVCLLVTPKMQP